VPLCLPLTHHTPCAFIQDQIWKCVQRWMPKDRVFPRRPYSILMMDEQAARCARCAPNSGCAGCILPSDSSPCDLTAKHTMCILWDNEDWYVHLKRMMSDEFVVMHESSRAPAKEEALSLYHCIERFAARETLGKDNQWYCSECKAFRQASKQFSLFKCPEILIVHLKRFFQISPLRREKINTLVDFPIRGLDLSKYISSVGVNESFPIYDLYAVSNHFGGMGGGHYTAFAKNFDNNCWYNFDDSRCTQMQVSAIQSSSAYVLYYKRRV